MLFAKDSNTLQTRNKQEEARRLNITTGISSLFYLMYLCLWITLYATQDDLWNGFNIFRLITIGSKVYEMFG